MHLVANVNPSLEHQRLIETYLLVTEKTNSCSIHLIPPTNLNISFKSF